MFVLDCSIAISWCLTDEQNDYADSILDHLVEQQAIVPSIWHLEIINVLLMAKRKKRIVLEKIPLVLNTLNALNISTDRRALGINNIEFLEFADQHQLTSYDAAYLHLALCEKLPLATLDKKMKNVAISLGLYLDS